MNSKIVSSVKTTTDYNNSQNIPKTISYFFLILQLVVGCDLGFSKLFDENVKKFMRIFSILQFCVYNITYITYNLIVFYPKISTISLALLPCLEYICNVIILFCYKKYIIYDFLCNISQFCKLIKNDNYILSFVTVVYFIIIYCFKIFLLLMIKAYYVKDVPYHDQLPSLYCLFLCLYYITIDLIAIALIVIFYYVYSSMKHLKAILISSDQKLNFISKQYKAIVETYETIRPISDSLVSDF